MRYLFQSFVWDSRHGQCIDWPNHYRGVTITAVTSWKLFYLLLWHFWHCCKVSLISVSFRGMATKGLSRWSFGFWSQLDYVFFLVLLLLCLPGEFWCLYNCDHYTALFDFRDCPPVCSPIMPHLSLQNKGRWWKYNVYLHNGLCNFWRRPRGLQYPVLCIWTYTARKTAFENTSLLHLSNFLMYLIYLILGFSITNYAISYVISCKNVTSLCKTWRSCDSEWSKE